MLIFIWHLFVCLLVCEIILLWMNCIFNSSDIPIPQNWIEPSVNNVGVFIHVSCLASPLRIQLVSGNPAMNGDGTRYNPAASH